MATTLPIFDTLIQYRNQVVNTGAINDDKIFHEKSICCIPSAVEHARAGIKQISDLLIIYLSERRFYRIFLVFSLRILPM